MNSKYLYGEILDHMLRLRNFFGQKHVFGIASTYEQWQIYWLNDNNCHKSAQDAQVKDTVHIATIEDVENGSMILNPMKIQSYHQI